MILMKDVWFILFAFVVGLIDAYNGSYNTEEYIKNRINRIKYIK
jgi:hypothetical protein